MTRNPDLERQRRELRQREAAARRKLNRIQRNGVEIHGSEFDPRRDNAPINQYTSKQIASYRATLDKFIHRSNQYVPDTYGRPIPRAEWQAYKRVERKANQMSEKAFEAIKHIYIPATGMTVAQREAATRSDFPRTADPAVNSPFKQIVRRPENMGSRKALQAAMKQQQKKVSPQYAEAFVKAGKAEAAKMFKALNDTSGLNERFQKLTTKQFHLAWGFAGLAHSVSALYEDWKADPDGKSRSKVDTDRGNMSDIHDVLEWIERT